MRAYLLKARAPLTPMYQIQVICRKSKLGNWFMLDQLAKNMDPVILCEFLAELLKKMEDQENFEEF
jgi:hypothetical protein